MLSKAKGSLCGALVGDAIGARLELMRGLPSPQDVSIALKMPGGGPFDLAPGQVTDDGEMTICLARGLLDAPNATAYPLQAVASRYRAWFASVPFGIGISTKTALAHSVLDRPDWITDIQICAHQHNMNSQANGALMRATPLGLWSVGHSPDTALHAAQQDTRLTHPNPVCQWATTAYVLTLRHVLLHSEDTPLAALNATRQRLEQAGAAAQEVLAWMDQAADGQLPDGVPHAGFVKIAFTHAFFHFLQTPDFEQAMRATLSIGGDTDTNACIVGGLMGAKLGLEHLPADMLHKVLTVNTREGQERPQWLMPHDALDIATRLISSPHTDACALA